MLLEEKKGGQRVAAPSPARRAAINKKPSAAAASLAKAAPVAKPAEAKPAEASKDARKLIKAPTELSDEENKAPNIGGASAAKSMFSKARAAKQDPQAKAVQSKIEEEESKGDQKKTIVRPAIAEGTKEVSKFAKMQQKWKKTAEQARENLQNLNDSRSLSRRSDSAASADNSFQDFSHSYKIVTRKRSDASQSPSPIRRQQTIDSPQVARQMSTSLALNKMKQRSQTIKRAKVSVNSENSAVVSPRDVQVTMQAEIDPQWADDPVGKSLKDMKDLFDAKLSTKWCRSKRQAYDAVNQWATQANLKQLVNMDVVTASASAELYRIVVAVPSTYQFIFSSKAAAQDSSIIAQPKSNTEILLKVSATLFDSENARFVGRTCMPKGIVMVAKSASSNTFGLKTDGHFEIYFFAEAAAKYSIVLDFYMEKQGKAYQARQAQSIGWIFTPIQCLPSIKALNMSQGIAPTSKFTLLKGSVRSLLDPTKASFEAVSQNYSFRIDSESLSKKLQGDLDSLKTLIPAAALFSDADNVPGVHCPLNEDTYDLTQNSKLVLAIRGCQSVKLIMKELRGVHLIRMRVHYLNWNEKALLTLLRTSYELRTGNNDFDLNIVQRRLNIRLHNTWMTFGPSQTINLAEPVKQGPKRQILEACANLQLEHLRADPLFCLLFEVVLEVRIETQDKVSREPVTIASIPYIPKLSRTRLQPVQIVDDYILETVSISKARSLCPNSSIMQVMDGIDDAQICLEGIISENEQIVQQVEIREQERQYQTQLDKMRRNRRRELERMGIRPGRRQTDDSTEDAAVVKVKIEQQKLLEQLDIVRARQVKFMQESQLLKFQSNDTTGMNYFDAIKRVIREGTIEVNSFKRRYRQNLKTLKTMERTQAKKGELCDYEDSEEEYERLLKDSQQVRVAEFTPHVSFSSRVLSKREAEVLVKDCQVARINQADVLEPVDESTILLHNEASDSCRINELTIHVVKTELKANELPIAEFLSDLELEEFKLNPESELQLQVSFGNLAPKTAGVKLRAGGYFDQIASFEYGKIDCQLNKDLADYFNLFQAANVKVTISLPGGPVFAHCSIDVKQSLRQQRESRVTAFEATLYDSINFGAIGSLQILVQQKGTFVNPKILAQLNTPDYGKKKVKKVRVRDPEWLKIKNKEDDDIVEEANSTTVSTVEDERKLRRIAAFKQRRTRATNDSRQTMKFDVPKVCTHSRSRSGSRDSSPASSMNRPMSASLVQAVRDRCVQPQVVHMTEEDFINQKRENFKPAALMDQASKASVVCERELDIRVGEPTFFYVMLDNPNENIRNTRTYSLQVCGHEKVESLVKLLTNFDEVNYWRLYGRLEDSVTINGLTVPLIQPSDVVETCILLNEFTVTGMRAVAVPFMLRTYKKTNFSKERLVIKASYSEQSIKKRSQLNPVESKSESHEELHKFTVTERYQPVMALKSFDAHLVRDKNHRQANVTLIPNFQRFFSEHLRPNFLGDVATYVNRLHFKSNHGKVILDEDGESLIFDPVEVPELPLSQRSIDLLVYTYTMQNKNQQSLSNPYDLAHVFQFQLRLVTTETHLKIEERLRPKKPIVEEDLEVAELPPVIRSDREFKEEVQNDAGDVQVEDIEANAGKEPVQVEGKESSEESKKENRVLSKPKQEEEKEKQKEIKPVEDASKINGDSKVESVRANIAEKAPVKVPETNSNPVVEKDQVQATKPEAAKPVSAKPEAAKPVAAKPEAAKPEAAASPKIQTLEITKKEETKEVLPKPEVAKPFLTKSDEIKPVVTKPVVEKSAATAIEEAKTLKPDVVKPQEEVKTAVKSEIKSTEDKTPPTVKPPQIVEDKKQTDPPAAATSSDSKPVQKPEAAKDNLAAQEQTDSPDSSFSKNLTLSGAGVGRRQAIRTPLPPKKTNE